ncbi:MAG: type III pantothenate kinase [Planctomycetota bacterium]
MSDAMFGPHEQEQHQDAPIPTGASVLAINVGNTRVQYAVFASGEHDARVGSADALPLDAMDEASSRLEALAASIEDEDNACVVIASTNSPASNDLFDRLSSSVGGAPGVFRIGEELAIPLQHRLETPETTGQDRLLNALAAHQVMRQATVVVDAGTALTVDFIDGEGVFQGGAIAPGARMMLHALHTQTSALPEIELDHPGEDPFGRSTRGAMLRGAVWGLNAMARGLIERYALAYEAYPSVVVTGGDADLIFAGDETVDRIVPDLTLRGIAMAARIAVDAEQDG